MIAAIVPAAGRSERMGRPKLLLPIGGQTVIARLIGALRGGGADPVVVVVPPASIAGAAELAVVAEQGGACVVVADPPPPEMRVSVERGLDRLRQMADPKTLLLAPGDSPGITAALVAGVVARARAEPDAIVIPTWQGRRGHPIALPWAVAAEIPGLPRGVGINALVAHYPERTVTLQVDDPRMLDDLDSPDDYVRWTGRDRDREGMDGSR
jgi:molybdenum cofactor cytidylyltransferase